MADLMTHLLWLSVCFPIDPARVFVGTQIVLCVRLFIFLCSVSGRGVGGLWVVFVVVVFMNL